MTPNFVIYIASSVSMASMSAGVYELWPPPDSWVALAMFLMALTTAPAGFLLRAYIGVVVAIENSPLAPEQKIEELGKVTKAMFGVFEKLSGVLKPFAGGGNGRN